MRAGAGERGFLSIVVLVMVAVLIALAIAMGYLLANSTLSAGSHVGAMQALFAAESGLEYEQRRWAQNLDWYRAASDPDPAAPAAQGVGAGTFTASANLPATLLRANLSVAAATVNVYTTDRFPATGILQIEDDVTGGAEFVRYTGAGAGSFTGVARGQAVGSVATVAAQHGRSSTVYPVTILRTAMAANCNPMASIQVDANGKFLSAGTLDIESEEVSYTGSTTAGGTMTLSGITRCLGTVVSVSHAIGQPVTPVLVGGDSASNQVEISSTGAVGPNLRYARRSIER